VLLKFGDVQKIISSKAGNKNSESHLYW